MGCWRLSYLQRQGSRGDGAARQYNECQLVDVHQSAARYSLATDTEQAWQEDYLYPSGVDDSFQCVQEPDRRRADTKSGQGEKSLTYSPPLLALRDIA